MFCTQMQNMTGGQILYKLIPIQIGEKYQNPQPRIELWVRLLTRESLLARRQTRWISISHIWVGSLLHEGKHSLVIDNVSTDIKVSLRV